MMFSSTETSSVGALRQRSLWQQLLKGPPGLGGAFWTCQGTEYKLILLGGCLLSPAKLLVSIRFQKSYSWLSWEEQGGNFQIPAQACSTGTKKSCSQMQTERICYWSHWLSTDATPLKSYSYSQPDHSCTLMRAHWKNRGALTEDLVSSSFRKLQTSISLI